MQERKKQRQLKRRLLRKRLRPMLVLVFKAFSPGYESVCVLMLEGIVVQVRDPTYIIQTGCQSLFTGVSLMENFDVKTRGPNQGTSTMQRAGINLDDFGATDFFSAVGLPEPQISLVGITD